MKGQTMKTLNNDTMSLDSRVKHEHDRRVLENGRSMVEMLGTLAIIGVLSIGGIMGYSYAMDKYRANETVNDINLRGIDLVRQVSMGQNPSLAGWEKTSGAGYTFSDAQLSAEGDAYFTLSGVPKRVCELVYAGIQNNQTTDVEVNEATNGDATDCNKDENTMGFFFITNAGEGGKTPEDLCKDISCPDGSSCTHGICMINEVEYFASEWRKCTYDTQCGVCEACDASRGRICAPIPDGSICGESMSGEHMICKWGDCIKKNICTDNSDCSFGYYCGKQFHLDYPENVSNQKSCIKTEVLNLTTNTERNFYVSNKKLTSQEDAIALCNSINTTLISDYTNNPDIVQRISEIAKGDTKFFGQTEHLDGKTNPTILNTTPSRAYALCINE